VRTFDQEVYDQIHTEVRRIAVQIGEGMDVEVSVEINGTPYPATINDADVTAFAAGVMQTVVGRENVDLGRDPTMGGEDFAFMAQQRPGCFVFIGNGNSAPLHSAKYDFNDDVAPIGVAYWTKLVETALPVG
jgi:hippurate hydrolase